MVQSQLRAALDRHGSGARILSLCAGEARDVIPVLADHPAGRGIRAWLIEIDERISATAASAARDAGLAGVSAICADAALTDSSAAAVPADIVVACGIFGNIIGDDIRRTIACLPALSAAGATVLWTLGRRPGHDVTPRIRTWFAETGFAELAFIAPEEETFSVGAHRLDRTPEPFRRAVRMFTFVR